MHRQMGVCVCVCVCERERERERERENKREREQVSAVGGGDRWTPASLSRAHMCSMHSGHLSAYLQASCPLLSLGGFVHQTVRLGE
jgi:hypothetical protein